MSFQHDTPEEVQSVCDSAMTTAEHFRRQGDVNTSAAFAIQAAIHLGDAQILDRLERIIMLLDERLPGRRMSDKVAGQEDPLSGTVEHRG